MECPPPPYGVALSNGCMYEHGNGLLMLQWWRNSLVVKQVYVGVHQPYLYVDIRTRKYHRGGSILPQILGSKVNNNTSTGFAFTHVQMVAQVVVVRSLLFSSSSTFVSPTVTGGTSSVFNAKPEPISDMGWSDIAFNWLFQVAILPNTP